MTVMSHYASAVDPEAYGEYRVPRPDGRPLYRFTGRITTDGSSGFRAESGRYHIYAGWSCPWSHRVTIARAINGLQGVVTVSYVDGARDGRGWAFRERHGVDPVNGFTLLRHAYEATEPGFDGHVSVPTLWDRETGQVVSNDFRRIGIDLATRFRPWSRPEVDTYPSRLRGEIEHLDSWIGPAVNRGMRRAAGDDAHAAAARTELLDAFARLERRLSRSRYLLGDSITEADIRLWVSLVRYDVGPNATGRINAGLPEYPHLWAYARDLYRHPAFQQTTDFGAFTDPRSLVPDWYAEDEPPASALFSRANVG